MAQYSRKLVKGIFWFYKFDFKGETYFSKLIYKSKQEAKIAEAERLGEVKKGFVPKTEKILLMDAISERLKYLYLKSSSKYYWDSNRYLKTLNKHFEGSFINDLTKQDVNDFIMELTTKYNEDKKSNYSVNASIRCYKAFFNFVNEHFGTEITNPFVKMKFFSIDKRIKYIPSDEEIDSLLKVCNKQQSRLVCFVMDTGARINEALNFTYGDIYDDYIVLYTRKSRNANRIPRKIPKPDCLNNLNAGKPSERVFYSWIDRPKFIEKKLKRLNRRTFGWHNLRHRYASRLSKQGKPIFEIMSLLGHSSIETTQLYLQLLP